MPHLWLRMTPQPPPGYVAFVARHLPGLRRDAVRLAGDEYGADELYPRALTDVAVRWAWFELLATLLRRPGAADAYLHETLVRRSARRQALAEQEEWVEIEVWRSDDARTALHPPPDRRRIDLVPRQRGPADEPAASRSSTALRLLPMLNRQLHIEVGPVAEAAVAWWYAYVAHRRGKLIALGAALALVFATMVRLARL